MKLSVNIEAMANPMTVEQFTILRTDIGDQKQVAKLLGCSSSTISRWESGQRIIPGPARVALRLIHAAFSIKRKR